MKILIICSKSFYKDIEKIKNELEELGHEVFLPNCYDSPETEDRYRNLGKEEHAKFKSEMFC
jgi:ribose 5-phosphate isomerase RpiB